MSRDTNRRPRRILPRARHRRINQSHSFYAWLPLGAPCWRPSLSPLRSAALLSHFLHLSALNAPSSTSSPTSDQLINLTSTGSFTLLAASVAHSPSPSSPARVRGTEHRHSFTGETKQRDTRSASLSAYTSSRQSRDPIDDPRSFNKPIHYRPAREVTPVARDHHPTTTCQVLAQRAS